MTAEQHGSKTDRIAELEREIAERDSDMRTYTLGSKSYCDAHDRRIAIVAELSRLRNEPATDEAWRGELVRIALEYGARYCDLQAKKWAREAMRPQPDRDKLDREVRQEAIANEKAFGDRAHRMRMALSATPSPPSVEAGRGEREALGRSEVAFFSELKRRTPFEDALFEAGYSRERAESIVSILADARLLTLYAPPPPPDTLAIPNARQSAHARFNAELGNAGKSIPEEKLARAFNTAMSVYEKLRRGAGEAGHSLIKGERNGISWGGSFYVEGNHESIDEVREMMFAKTRCEALDKMISDKQLVRPTAPPSNPDGVREALEAVERLVSQCEADCENEATRSDSDEDSVGWSKDGPLPMTFGHIRNARKALMFLSCTTLPSRTGLEEAAEVALAIKGNAYLWAVTDAGQEGFVTACNKIAEALRTRAAKTTAPAGMP